MAPIHQLLRNHCYAISSRCHPTRSLDFVFAHTGTLSANIQTIVNSSSTCAIVMAMIESLVSMSNHSPTISILPLSMIWMRPVAGSWRILHSAGENV